jgi:phage terminase small subunit
MSDQILQISLSDAPPVEPVRLTRKQRLFIHFYLGDAKFNGSKAARLAGYANRCASSMAASNLRKPRIVREIERLLGLMGLTPHEITGRLGMMARGEIPTKTTVKGDELTQVFDERQALEDAARIHGMLIDKHQIQALPTLLIEDSE